MVLLIYTIIIVIWVLDNVLLKVFKKEKEKEHSKERYNKFLNKSINIFESLDTVIIMRVEPLYCIFMLIYGIYTKNWIVCSISISFLVSILLSIVYDRIDYFKSVIHTLQVIAMIIWILLSVFICGFGALFGTDGAIEYGETQKLKTINILEFKQSEYNSVKGGKWYIKSAPSNAYYYEVRTKNGGTTTKVIDGTVDYVEKYEDNKYIENPHIDVFKGEKCEKFTNFYGFRTTVFDSTSSYYEYYIYIPENSTFYEK